MLHSSADPATDTDHRRRLDLLADTIVAVGLGLATGQELVIQAPLDAAPLVRPVAAAAYRAGCPLVSVVWDDPKLGPLRLAHAPDDSFDRAPQWQMDAVADALAAGAACLYVVGNDPSLLKGQDPTRVARLTLAGARAGRRILDQVVGFRINWSVAACVTPAWARAVFPNLPPEQAEPALWAAIFEATRVDQADPVGAWRAHVAELQARADHLNHRRYTALRFRGPGTDLTVGLAERSLWRGAAFQAENGSHCVPNLPTEEVFTMPHKDRVDGVVRTTMPLSYAGTLIEGIAMRFERGRAVHVDARFGGDVLRRMMQTDDGASRLGEVALVPASSVIARSGRLFQNTLFDENAASHIALGRCLSVNSEDGLTLDRPSIMARGGNESLIHVDWMIGSPKVDIDGIAIDGSAEPVMRAGEWS